MKKFVSVILSICIIMSMSIGAFATDKEELFEINGEFFTAEEIAESEIVFEKYLKKGEVALNKVQRDTWASLKVSLLLQTDSRWSSLQFPCSHDWHTYGKYGCAMTSYSMVLNYYGNNTTPVTVAEKYHANNSHCCCHFQSDLLLKDYSGRSRDLVSDTLEESYSKIKTTIVGALADGYPVIVKIKTDNNGNYHFVVCYAYVKLTSGEFKISIRDPMGTHTYLDEYYNEGKKPASLSIVK